MIGKQDMDLIGSKGSLINLYNWTARFILQQRDGSFFLSFYFKVFGFEFSLRCCCLCCAVKKRELCDRCEIFFFFSLMRINSKRRYPLFDNCERLVVFMEQTGGITIDTTNIKSKKEYSLLLKSIAQSFADSLARSIAV